MISTAIALAMGLQGTAAAPAAEEIGRDLETGQKQWTFEYDIAILPYIEDYKRCLNYANRIARGAPDFEEQHREDLPRCADVKAKAVAASKDVLERRGLTEIMSFEDVDRTFEVVGLIHIERGRHIDTQFADRVRAYAAAGAANEITESGIVGASN